MTTLALDTLLATLTPEQALAQELELATTAELPVTAWEEGDNTLTLLEVIAFWLAAHRRASRTILSAGWLDHAEDTDALTATAREVYGVDRIEQTYATGRATITNSGDDTHTIGANDLSLEVSGTGATYRNTSPSVGTVDLAPGATLEFDVIADVAGSSSSADAGDLDLVTSGQLGLTCSNATASVGRDRESGPALVARCRLKVPAISKTAAGPRGKYAYVAITPSENGGAAVTRANVEGNTATGAVVVTLAGPSGPVSTEDRARVQEALVLWVIGPTESLSVVSSVGLTINIEYELWVYDSVNRTDDEIREDVSTRLRALFAVAPIGGWVKPSETGKVPQNLLEAVIKSTTAYAFDVALAAPIGDTVVDSDEVPVLGTVEGTITRVPAPATGGTF